MPRWICRNGCACSQAGWPCVSRRVDRDAGDRAGVRSGETAARGGRVRAAAGSRSGDGIGRTALTCAGMSASAAGTSACATRLGIQRDSLQHPFQPLHTAFPARAHLAHSQAGFLGDFFEREAAEVVPSTMRAASGFFASRRSIRMPISTICCASWTAGPVNAGFVQRECGFTRTAAGRQPVSRQVHQNAPHREAEAGRRNALDRGSASRL